MMTIETAAARYLQIADLEHAMTATEASIVDVQAEIDDAAAAFRAASDIDG